jgi:hypothetical protein
MLQTPSSHPVTMETCMWTLLTSATIAGLMGAPHCMGMCGGFAAAMRRPAEQAAWQAGRLTTYAALGATVGALGGALPAPGWVLDVLAILFLLFFCAQLAGLIRPLEGRAPRLIAAGSSPSLLAPPPPGRSRWSPSGSAPCPPSPPPLLGHAR